MIAVVRRHLVAAVLIVVMGLLCFLALYLVFPDKTTATGPYEIIYEGPETPAFDAWIFDHCIEERSDGRNYAPYRIIYRGHAERSEWASGDGRWTIHGPPEEGESITYRYHGRQIDEHGTYQELHVSIDFDHKCKPVPDSTRIDILEEVRGHSLD